MNNVTSIENNKSAEMKITEFTTAVQKSPYEIVIEGKRDDLVATRRKLQFQVEVLDAQINVLNEILNSGDIQKRKGQ